MQRNARLLLGLINDVLDISRIESGKTEVRREALSVSALLQQVETDFGDMARRRGIVFRTAASPELDTVSQRRRQTDADPLQPRRVTRSSSRRRGSIEVRAEPRGSNRWALVVTDSGIGIPPEEQESIFEEFRQGESEAHQGHGGTGLGLAIVRKLVRLLGGTVSVQSAPGDGASFAVNLPRELAAEPRESPEDATSDGRDGRRRAFSPDEDEAVSAPDHYGTPPARKATWPES